MALLEDLTKGSVSTVLVGVGVALVSPIVFPAIAAGFRPLAKTLVKGGVAVYDAVKEAVVEAGEQFNDLVAEVRAETAEEAMAAEATAAHEPTKKKEPH